MTGWDKSPSSKWKKCRYCGKSLKTGKEYSDHMRDFAKLENTNHLRRFKTGTREDNIRRFANV